MTRALIKVPATAKQGEIIEIKNLISHPMETGYRRDAVGNTIQRDVMNRFVCLYNDLEVFRAELSPAIAANLFPSFSTVAVESGTIEFQRTNDQGTTQAALASIKVE
jgi:sulfur-oxidizing protein SoxZ